MSRENVDEDLPQVPLVEDLNIYSEVEFPLKYQTRPRYQLEKEEVPTHSTQ